MSITIRIFIVVMFILFLSVSGQSVSAQNSGSNLDALDRSLEPKLQPKSKPKPKVELDETREPGFDSSINFTLKSITIEDSTIFTQEDFLAPYIDLIGREITFNDINQLTVEMTKKYREAGYFLSRVALPAQEVEATGADIRLVALEGYISQINWDGDEALISQVSSYFSKQKDKLLSLRPLKFKDLERAMTVLSDTPGLLVSSSFEPAQEPNATNLTIMIKRKVIGMGVEVNNSGTESSGPFIANGRFSIYSFPIIGNQFDIAYTQAFDFQEYYNIHLQETYNWANGFSAFAAFDHSVSARPDSVFARLFEQATSSKTLKIGTIYWILRKRDLNLSTGVNFTHRNSQVDLLNLQFSEDRIRSLNYNLNFDFADEIGGVTQFLLSYTNGFKGMNATDIDPKSSSPIAPADFQKANLYFSRTQSLFAGLSLMAAGELQFAWTVLPSYEQFSLGGQHFGRGYETGIIESDKGVSGLIELRYLKYLTDSIGVQPYAFLDGGVVSTYGRISGVDPHEELASFGAGFRIWMQTGDGFTRNFSLNTYVGKPLIEVDRNEKSPRWNLSASFDF
jgi:hemolysin activation/secretion protein